MQRFRLLKTISLHVKLDLLIICYRYTSSIGAIIVRGVTLLRRGEMNHQSVLSVDHECHVCCHEETGHQSVPVLFVLPSQQSYFYSNSINQSLSQSVSHSIYILQKKSFNALTRRNSAITNDLE